MFFEISQIARFCRTPAGLCASLFVIAAACVGFLWEKQIEQIPFESHMWVSGPSQRFRMVDEVIQMLDGMTEDKVRDLLGPPESERLTDVASNLHLLYWVNDAGVDDEWLDIVITDGLVTRASRHPD